MALMKMPCAVGTGGGSVNYDMTDWSNAISGGQKASFTNLSGKPKAVYIIASGSGGQTRIVTNVNQSTGEVDETGQTVYTSYCLNGGTFEQWAIVSSWHFTIGDNSVEPSSALLAVSYKQLLLYTF